MAEAKVLDILKGAILLEKKGKVFYEKTAAQTESAAVREVFETMAKEEDHHVEILTNQFESYRKNGRLAALKYNASPEPVSNAVLTRQIRDEIHASSYEAAAISAAMAMEDKAVAYYSGRAHATDDAEEKRLYEWLAIWEKTHLQFLSDIDKELQQNVWYDNQFWPM
ncbi:MAG: ferritin-like domain-containing protein [Candidatus Zhuqueibacterota bacterium]